MQATHLSSSNLVGVGPNGSKFNVHNGMHGLLGEASEAGSSYSDEILAAIEAGKAAFGDAVPEVVYTGHSLGGGLATICRCIHHFRPGLLSLLPSPSPPSPPSLSLSPSLAVFPSVCHWLSVSRALLLSRSLARSLSLTPTHAPFFCRRHFQLQRKCGNLRGAAGGGQVPCKHKSLVLKSPDHFL